MPRIARDATAGGCLGLRSFFLLYRLSAFSATHAHFFLPLQAALGALEAMRGIQYFNSAFK
jgi:hypothetical protein